MGYDYEQCSHCKACGEDDMTSCPNCELAYCDECWGKNFVDSWDGIDGWGQRVKYPFDDIEYCSECDPYLPHPTDHGFITFLLAGRDHMEMMKQYASTVKPEKTKPEPQEGDVDRRNKHHTCEICSHQILETRTFQNGAWSEWTIVPTFREKKESTSWYRDTGYIAHTCTSDEKEAKRIIDEHRKKKDRKRRRNSHHERELASLEDDKLLEERDNDEEMNAFEEALKEKNLPEAEFEKQMQAYEKVHGDRFSEIVTRYRALEREMKKRHKKEDDDDVSVDST